MVQRAARKLQIVHACTHALTLTHTHTNILTFFPSYSPVDLDVLQQKSPHWDNGGSPSVQPVCMPQFQRLGTRCLTKRSRPTARLHKVYSQSWQSELCEAERWTNSFPTTLGNWWSLFRCLSASASEGTVCLGFILKFMPGKSLISINLMTDLWSVTHEGNRIIFPNILLKNAWWLVDSSSLGFYSPTLILTKGRLVAIAFIVLSVKL